MPKRLSQEEFIERATEAHNGKYDYSKVEYKNVSTKVCIICPEHGEFWQTPNGHLYQKQGCTRCRSDNMKNKICGVGVNDYEYAIKNKDIHLLSYKCWHSMISRCYNPKEQQKHPTYKGCIVCDEWKYFSNFKKWFDENYKYGYELDKDILSKNNKYYSPQTCLFIPKYINNLIRTRTDGVNKMGVFYDKRIKKYIARTTFNGKTKYSKICNSEEEAYQEYKKIKYLEINRVVTKAFENGDIDKRTYDALMHYEIML